MNYEEESLSEDVRSQISSEVERVLEERKKLKDGVEYLRSVIFLTQKSENLSSFEVARLDGMRVALSMVTGEKF